MTAKLSAARVATERAFADAPDVVYQASFFDWEFVGYADFVEHSAATGEPRHSPEPVGESALGWLMVGAETIPPARGYFLGQSYRLPPALCEKVSTVRTVVDSVPQHLPAVASWWGSNRASVLSAHCDVPRGMEFLLNRNRTNVAVSRAKWQMVLI